MVTLKKLKSVVLFVALMAGVSSFAQVPQQMQQKKQTKTKVKDAELQEFANVSQKLNKKNQEVREKMVDIIKKEGLTVQEYQKLQASQNNPKADTDASSKDMQKKKKIDAEIDKVSPKFQQEQKDIVKKSKLSIDRFKEIASALRSDPDLQKRFRQIMMKKQQQ